MTKLSMVNWLSVLPVPATASGCHVVSVPLPTSTGSQLRTMLYHWHSPATFVYSILAVAHPYIFRSHAVARRPLLTFQIARTSAPEADVQPEDIAVK
jgi:hypothetical protein